MRTLLALACLSILGCDERDNPAYGGGHYTNQSRALYPAGPYGQAEGETLPNWTFVDALGNETSLQDIRGNTFATTLVLLPSAQWMEAAPGMLNRANTLFDEGRDDVLIVSAVFEDGSAKAADAADAQAWQQNYEVPWSVLAEHLGQFRLAWRNDMRAAVLIDLDTMKRLDPDRRPGIRDVLWP